MSKVVIFVSYNICRVLNGGDMLVWRNYGDICCYISWQDQLGQDVFLIGPPGPLRRNVAMMYLVCFLSYC